MMDDAKVDMPEEGGISGVDLLMAFLGGAVIGGGAALLLAPKSGPETRHAIAGLASKSRDWLARRRGNGRDTGMHDDEGFLRGGDEASLEASVADGE